MAGMTAVTIATITVTVAVVVITAMPAGVAAQEWGVGVMTGKGANK